MKELAQKHLQEHILPYWNNLQDEKYGGFYGFVDYDLNIDKQAHKGVILHSRILWFYSTVYSVLGGEDNRLRAECAYKFLKNHCYDSVYGGLYWMMTHDGAVADDTKNAYNQAFGIYGLSAYYKATGSKEALTLAYDLYRTLEAYCNDGLGYLEAFTRDWKNPVESAICDQGIVAEKTMNTLLHVLEAYTVLLEVDNHPVVAERLCSILELCRDKLYYADFERLEVFFDGKMMPLGDIHSYGHDIEASWLLDRACDVLEKNLGALKESRAKDARAVIADTHAYATVIAKKILSCAFKDGALNNEARGERTGNVHVDTDRIWWVQAETVVGFYNEYQKNKDDAFKDASKQQFDFIEKYVLDPRKNSEWFWYTTHDGTPKTDHGMTEAWKCPYHNGRMCLELITRNASL